MAFYPSGRRIVYTNEVPFETDILSTNDYHMAGDGWLAEAIIGFGIGNTTTVVGLPCTPVIPPGLSVVVGPGAMFSYEFYDSTAYGVIPPDVNPNHQLYKTAMNWDPVTLATPAPPTPGDSIIYLIEGIFETIDVNDVSRPYFNSTDPTMPIFLNNFDTRTDIIVFQAKPGVPNVTPTPPTPDPGYTGLYYVTVANGQTSIVSGNIAKVSMVEGQPFITEGLTQKISSATVADDFVSIPSQQMSTYIYGNDVGSPNLIVVNPANAYPAYVPGTIIDVLIANTNTGASTLNISAQGAVSIKILTPLGLVNLTGGELVAGMIAQFQYNGSSFQLFNPAVSNVNYSQVSFLPASTQAIPNGVWTKVQLDNVITDANGWWNTGSFRFTPTIAGKYRVSLVLSGYSLVISASFVPGVYKNGLLYRVGSQLTYGNGGSGTASFIIPANGTTDFFELFVVTQAGGTTVGNALVGYPANINGTTENLFEIEYIGT